MNDPKKKKNCKVDSLYRKQPFWREVHTDFRSKELFIFENLNLTFDILKMKLFDFFNVVSN